MLFIYVLWRAKMIWQDETVSGHDSTWPRQITPNGLKEGSQKALRTSSSWVRDTLVINLWKWQKNPEDNCSRVSNI